MGAIDTEKATKLIAEGLSIRAIARLFGVTPVTVRRQIDDGFRVKLNARQGEYYRRQRASVAGNHQAARNPPEEDWKSRVAEIPTDTRGLTGRLCGDPILERSALYKRMTDSKDIT